MSNIPIQLATLELKAIAVAHCSVESSDETLDWERIRALLRTVAPRRGSGPNPDPAQQLESGFASIMLKKGMADTSDDLARLLKRLNDASTLSAAGGHPCRSGSFTPSSPR